MHPPPFNPGQRLSDWPDCRLELRCPGCGSIAVYPVTLFIRRRGDQTFSELLGRLSCRRCGATPAPVYLCAGFNRQHCNGAPPDWAVELVQAPGE